MAAEWMRGASRSTGRMWIGGRGRLRPFDHSLRQCTDSRVASEVSTYFARVPARPPISQPNGSFVMYLAI